MNTAFIIKMICNILDHNWTHEVPVVMTIYDYMDTFIKEGIRYSKLKFHCHLPFYDIFEWLKYFVKCDADTTKLSSYKLEWKLSYSFKKFQDHLSNKHPVKISCFPVGYSYVQGSLNKFPDFFVWALLLIVHTLNSSPLRSNLLRLQCTCCTVPTTSGRHQESLVWACHDLHYSLFNLGNCLIKTASKFFLELRE